MSSWRALHAYTTELDEVLRKVVGPFLESEAATLDHGFWERHYVGGPHLRIRLRAAPETLSAKIHELRRSLETWLTIHDPPPPSNYSPEAAADLLRMEYIDPATEDLTPRHNVVVEAPYPEHGKAYASVGARTLAENFRRARGPIALQLLDDPRSLRAEVLKLYFALAIYAGRGQLPLGAVSFKSHFEHFAATLRSDALLAKFHSHYELHRDEISRQLEQVVCAWHGAPSEPGALLAAWWKLLRRTHTEARALLETGQELVKHLTKPDVIALRAGFSSRAVRQSTFLDTMWGDPSFIALLRYDLPFQLLRALVNLLYDLVAAVSLSPIDKMLLAHHAFRAVEERESCDLNDYLKANMERVVSTHGHRSDKRQVSAS